MDRHVCQSRAGQHQWLLSSCPWISLSVLATGALQRPCRMALLAWSNIWLPSTSAPSCNMLLAMLQMLPDIMYPSITAIRSMQHLQWIVECSRAYMAYVVKLNKHQGDRPCAGLPFPYHLQDAAALCLSSVRLMDMIHMGHDHSANDGQ